MAKPCTPYLIAQRVQLFKIKTANVQGQGVRPLAFLWGFQRGYSLSKENIPFGTPRERRGESPSTPNIAGLQLEELHALRNVSAVYMASP